MKVFKDIFSGDELFTDSYEVKLVDDVLYEVIGKHVSRTEGDIQLEGANASAEEFDEGTESTSVSGIDFVLDNRLVETGFGSKKDYTVYLKDYMKKVQKYLEENGRKDEVDAFKAGAQKAVKELLGKFKDLRFYQGESMDPTAAVLIVDYKEIDGEEKPILLVFSHGVLAEKV